MRCTHQAEPIGDSCEHCPADGGGCIVCTSPNVIATAKREHAAAIRADLDGSENLTADLDEWRPAESVNEAIDRVAAIRDGDKQAIGEAMLSRADDLKTKLRLHVRVVATLHAMLPDPTCSLTALTANDPYPWPSLPN